LKNLYFVFILGLLSQIAKSQSYNYQEFGVGFGVSSTRGYTNVARQDNDFAFNINASYNYSPYLPVTAELQIGKLSGGGTTPNLDRYGRQYLDNYRALYVHIDLQAGELIDYQDSFVLGILKNFYIGTGFGVIEDNNTDQRLNLYPYDGSTSYIFPGKDHAYDPIVPLRFGYEFNIYNQWGEPAFRIDLGYEHNIDLGENLDGYNDNPLIFKHNALPQYRQITIGFKYNFGNITSYNKSIR
jgi:hypothetical protein